MAVTKYKDYPEGSGGKKLYDLYFLPFQDFLNKYYSNPDLSRWEYITRLFIIPLFDGTTWDEYSDFLHKAKPKFQPSKNLIDEFWIDIKNDNRFSLELKQFFAFLYSIGFYRDLSFDEWLNIPNWRHPWYIDNAENTASIIELIKFDYSENFIKTQLATLSIF